MADEGVDTLAESPFSPVHWALASIAVWLAYVGLKGWHACGVWERREVAFGVFSALLLMNFLSLDEQFKVCWTAPVSPYHSFLCSQQGVTGLLPST